MDFYFPPSKAGGNSRNRIEALVHSINDYKTINLNRNVALAHSIIVFSGGEKWNLFSSSWELKNMQKYHPNIHQRKSIRLKGYDYTQAGLYFITICCQDRACRVGSGEIDEMILNDAWKMVETEWMHLKIRFTNIE